MRTFGEAVTVRTGKYGKVQKYPKVFHFYADLASGKFNMQFIYLFRDSMVVK